MSADNLDLSRVQRPRWDTGRRYGETCNPSSPRFSQSCQQDGLHATDGPAATSALLAADGSREASGASPRKRLSGQLCTRPLKPALLSPRKLVSPDLWSTPHAEPGGIRSPSSPPSLRRLLPAYRPLVPSTIMRARRQVQRVRNEKVPAVAAQPTSSVPPPGPEHHYACSETGTASTR